MESDWLRVTPPIRVRGERSAQSLWRCITEGTWTAGRNIKTSDKLDWKTERILEKLVDNLAMVGDKHLSLSVLMGHRISVDAFRQLDYKWRVWITKSRCKEAGIETVQCRREPNCGQGGLDLLLSCIFCSFSWKSVGFFQVLKVKVSRKCLELLKCFSQFADSLTQSEANSRLATGEVQLKPRCCRWQRDGLCVWPELILLQTGMSSPAACRQSSGQTSIPHPERGGPRSCRFTSCSSSSSKASFFIMLPSSQTCEYCRGFLAVICTWWRV